MAGWRTKLIFMLVIYFAGFATAIYVVAPASEGPGQEPGQSRKINFDKFKSDEFAAQMEKYMGRAKDATASVSKLLKEKLEAHQTRADG